MKALSAIQDSLLGLFFPHYCEGCGNSTISRRYSLCLQCLSALPETDFAFHENNPVEKIFWGRVPMASAGASYYFTKGSLMQHLMHQFKYKGNKELGRQLGQLMGRHLLLSKRFDGIDSILPLPLFAARQSKRGFNQAAVLCEGLSDILKIEVQNNVVIRTTDTSTQTKKNRMERWENMEGKFEFHNDPQNQGKHFLLVDDVITTGATLEACAQVILNVPGTKLSVFTLCYASR